MHCCDGRHVSCVNRVSHVNGCCDCDCVVGNELTVGRRHVVVVVCVVVVVVVVVNDDCDGLNVNVTLDVGCGCADYVDYVE